MKKILIFGAIILIAILAITFVVNQSKISNIETLEFNEHVFSQVELSGEQANNAPAPITPNCKIKGIITDVQFVATRNNSCIDFNKCVGNSSIENCCPEDSSPSELAHYAIFVYVQELESLDTANNGNYQAQCEDSIKINSSEIFFIYDIGEIPKSRLKIEGIVGNAYIRSLNSYILNN